MPPADPLLSIRDVSKDYRGLRPLRVASLDLAEGQSLALLGFDQAMAEVLVRLIMGASLPDTGEVVVFGQPTNAIADGDAWLEWLERFALLGDRTVLVDQLTAEQTIALPISFVVDEPTGEVRRSVTRVAEEVGLERQVLAQPAGALTPLARARVRLARALMSSPRLLLAEHPTASLSGDDTNRFAADVSRVVRGRRLTMLLLTADRGFASAAAGHVLTLQPSTGALTAATSWRRWFNG
jgi:predicted ABC-type transport system involved in lysophospholipase L1 biosynthesis ATPase subunit